jgi:hypothetical protein
MTEQDKVNKLVERILDAIGTMHDELYGDVVCEDCEFANTILSALLYTIYSINEQQSPTKEIEYRNLELIGIALVNQFQNHAEERNEPATH